MLSDHLKVVHCETRGSLEMCYYKYSIKNAFTRNKVQIQSNLKTFGVYIEK